MEKEPVDPSKPIPVTPESYGTHEMKPSPLVDKHRGPLTKKTSK